jgi:dipeptidyl aminopeptidase/acylaminoacyl peptidase
MRRILILLFFASSLASTAQKANFKAAEKFLDINTQPLLGDIAVAANWIEGTDIFWYSYKTSEGRNFYIVNAATKLKQPLFDNKLMASELRRLTRRTYNENDLPVQNIEFQKKSTTRFSFTVDSLKFVYDMPVRKLTVSDTVRRESRRTAWASWSPDSAWIVFTRKHNLFIMRAKDKDSIEYKLTSDGERFYSYAGSGNSADTSSRRQRASVTWFKNSEKFYVMRRDMRKVKDLYVINSLTQPRPELETYRYAMPGDEFVPQYELGVFDIKTRSKTRINTEKWKDQTVSVEWTSQENSDKLIFIRTDRPLKNLDVCSANTSTGEVKVLFSEETWPYFNNEYTSLHVLNEGKDMIWWSERTGWGQFYHYDGSGKLLNPITDGYFVAGSIHRIDTLGRTIYFEAFGREPGVHPYYNMKYKASIDRTGMTLLTKEPADHSFSMSKSCKYFVDNYSTVDTEPVSVLRDNTGSIVIRLEKADLSQLYKAGWKMPEPFVVKARDGITDLYGVMYKPFDFDSTKKYPVISNVYPGPQYERVPYGFTVNGEKNFALAQVGFIVVNFGHRGGSPMRNTWYHTFGYNDLRDYPLADDKFGLEQLADMYKFIDIERVGIYGRSGGGFMSTAALLTYPDFYDVAVSPAGNHDNNIYNQWWGETHNGVTQVERKNRSGTETAVSFRSSIEKNQDLARNLKGHLLLIHGEIDNNVHPANTMRVAEALMKANKRFDMIIVPGQRHTYGSATDYLDRIMWYYFAEHLLGDYRTNVDLMEY